MPRLLKILPLTIDLPLRPLPKLRFSSGNSYINIALFAVRPMWAWKINLRRGLRPSVACNPRRTRPDGTCRPRCGALWIVWSRALAASRRGTALDAQVRLIRTTQTLEANMHLGIRGRTAIVCAASRGDHRGRTDIVKG